MWSLPDIARLNERAAAEADTLRRQAETLQDSNGDPLKCERCEESEATVAYLWHDIFSEDPKGVIALCEKCDSYTGDPIEGYFTCCSCGKVFIENYSWELYYHDSENNGPECLNCFAERIVSDDDYWLPLADEVIESLTFEDIRHSPHCVAVRGPIPDGISFVSNVELDASCGGRLTTTATCEPTPDGGVEEIKSILREQKTKGHKRAILILDAAFQWSVSIGVYVDALQTRSGA